MKKAILTALIFSSFAVFAQQADVQIQKEQSLAPVKKEKQEVIIRSNGDKEISLKVDINGDNVTINGKPLVEFKDDNVTINKRKMIIHDGGDIMTFNFDGPHGTDEWMALDDKSDTDYLKKSVGPGLPLDLCVVRSRPDY